MSNQDKIRALSESYEFIDSYSKIKSGVPRKYIRIRHKYCNETYEVRLDSIPNLNRKCPKCCGSYENSFAYHIEVELGLNINDVWNFEKNTVNPYHISRGYTKTKILIKCQEKDYHGSYEISCSDFIRGYRCSYCASKKVHPKDSFGQYLKENNILHLWSDKNTIDPFTISKSNSKKIWMLCDKVDYHNDYGGYEIICANFIIGKRCSYCNPSGKISKVHPLDSFGQKYQDKAKCWHEDNDKSPYEVAPNTHKKYKFRCDKCGCIWSSKIYNISSSDTWCPKCNSSKGEKRIEQWLIKNNIQYEPQKTYDGLIGVGGGLLSYDFYLPNHNLLIEYQGEFHDGNNSCQLKDDLNKQKNHDKIKKQYSIYNNIKLLEIWYWDFYNIETILDKELS